MSATVELTAGLLPPRFRPLFADYAEYRAACLEFERRTGSLPTLDQLEVFAKHQTKDI
jgi:hypothetical protein